MSSGAGKDHVSFDHSVFFSNVFGRIDKLTSETESTVLKEITKHHWKPYDSKTSCFNRLCRKQFSIILERHHHCRRCGEIFCSACLQFSRRLNKLARPDPDGEWHKVCQTCFEQGQLTDGQIYSHTTLFCRLRKTFQKQAAVKETLESPLWRCKLDLDRECQRLLRGFEQCVGQSEIKRTLHGMKSLIATPEWMKSRMWIREDIATSCQICHEAFSITKQKNFCRTCGISVCKSCSSEDLLLYIPDEEKEKGGSCPPRLAIIKIVGCPEIEPEISWHLRVCPSCRDKLKVRQVQTIEDKLNPLNNEAFLDHLHKHNQTLQEAENRVTSHLPKYREIVESLDDSTQRSNNSSNVKILAKAQGDLADVLAQYITIFQQVRRLRPMTDTQASLLKNFIKAKCDFYLSKMSTFRTLKNKLCESVPAECLDFIQRTMDKNAIISTHLILRQLVYETIHLCIKHKTEEYLPTFLTQMEQVVESDVIACLHKENNDVQEHLTLVREMIKIGLQERKLISLSPTQYDKKDSKYNYKVLQQRVEDILNQVNNQLCLMSATRSFQTSKESLKAGLVKLKQYKKLDDDDEKDDGFIFVHKPD